MNGTVLPNAWDIDLDIPVIGFATPQGNALLRIYGVSIQEVSQANNWAKKNIAVYAGMAKGLPLATLQSTQSGLIARGYVLQCFGNRIGLDQTLDFVIQPGPATSTQTGGTGTVYQPKNLVLNWPMGTPLSGPLQNALQTAFPGVSVSVNISPAIVNSSLFVKPYPTLQALAQDVLEISLNIVKTSNYPGVAIVFGPNGIYAFDGTAPAASSSSSGAAAGPTQIQFSDMIGQPTWIESPLIQFKTVMRADLTVGGKIILPPTLIVNTAAAAPSLINQQVSFQGGFTLANLRHVGRFRNPLGDAWVTVEEAYPNQIQAAA